MPVKVPIPYYPYDVIEQLVRIEMKPVVESSISPESIPTTEPSTGQFDRTIQETDFPTITPSGMYAIHVAYVAMAGQNTSTSAVTLYWRMYKNSNVVSSGSFSVSAGYFWRLICTWLGVYIGDRIEVRLWGSASGLNYDFTAFQIHPTRLYSSIIVDRPNSVRFSGFAAYPVFTTANAPAGSVTQTGISVQHLDITLQTITADSSYQVLTPRLGYGLFRVAYGDASSPINTGSSSTTTSRSGLTQLRSVIPSIIYITTYRLW